jgi:hypothetical protein
LITLSSNFFGEYKVIVWVAKVLKNPQPKPATGLQNHGYPTKNLSTTSLNISDSAKLFAFFLPHLNNRLAVYKW